MPEKNTDFESWTKWSEDTFARLTELFRYQVSSYVTTRLLTIGTAVITIVGVLSYFGITLSAKQIMAESIKNEVKKQVEQEMGVAKEIIGKEVENAKQSAIEARTEIGISRGITALTRAGLVQAQSDVEQMIAQLEPLRLSLVEYQSKFESLKKAIADAETLLEKGTELNLVATLPVQAKDGGKDLLGRIRQAHENLADDPKNEHERLVLTRYVQEVGEREFKRADTTETNHKRDAIKILTELLRKTPQQGKMSLEGDDFRQIRVQTIYALRSFASNEPAREEAIRALTLILKGQGVMKQYLEPDGAAWALECLTDDGYLRKMVEELTGRSYQLSATQKVFKDALTALAQAARGDSAEEVKSVALSTLRSFASMKSRWFWPLFRYGLITRTTLAPIDSRRAWDLGMQGEENFNQGNWHEAMDAVDEYLLIRPYALDQMTNKVELHLILEEYNEAEKLTRKLRAENKYEALHDDEFETLFDYFDAVRMLMSTGMTVDYEQAKNKLKQSANIEVVSRWDFSIFQRDYIEKNRLKIMDESNNLIQIALGNLANK